jgi:TonB family protein
VPILQERPKSLSPKPIDRALRLDPAAQQQQQRRRMLIALLLLLVALVVVVVKNRSSLASQSSQIATEADLPDTEAAVPPAGAPATPAAAPQSAGPAAAKKRVVPNGGEKEVAQAVAPVINRTLLPPLEIEVVAGNQRRPARPTNNSVKVGTGTELAQPAETTPASAQGAAGPASASEVTATASERVRISPETTQAVRHPVTPNYPLLARQMKVQGAVILQALIARDGNIQDLRVMSGPSILSAAAMEAVRQWRFKPYYQEGQPVETKARITVNFTISTN